MTRVLLLALLAAGLIAGPAARPAAAHTRVVGTLPSDGTTVEAAPARVEIFFDSKPVTVEGDPVRVYGPSGTRVDDGRARITGRRGTALAVGLPGDDRLPAGEYQVVYRIVSRDTHLIAGHFSFHTRHPREVAGGAGATARRQAVAPPATPAADDRLTDGCSDCRHVPPEAGAGAGALAAAGIAGRFLRRRWRRRRNRRYRQRHVPHDRPGPGPPPGRPSPPYPGQWTTGTAPRDGRRTGPRRPVVPV